MTEENVRRGFLDADIIIQLGKCGFDLLEEVVNLFDKCYLHKRVYREVDFPPECVEIIERLIKTGKVILIEDKYLLEEVGEKGLFLLTLQQACNFFNKDYYQKYYADLHDLEDQEIFLGKIKEIGDEINDIGEIRTLHMIITLFSQEDTVNYFISNDSGARNGIVLNYTRNEEVEIQGVSLMSVFHYLKDKISKNKALEFVEKLDIKRVKIYNPDGSRDSVFKEEFIETIYDREYSLKKIGDIKLLEKI